MAETNNSISTLLPQLLRLYNNSVESFSKISEAVTGSENTVAIDYTDTNGQQQRIFVPSFGYLRNEIQRLDENVKSITNFNPGTSSSIRLSDGTFRKLVLKEIATEASDLGEIGSVNTFDTKSNWFFESLITPLLYVSFDLTGQAPINTERIQVKRYILNLDTEAKKDFFYNELQGRSDINYNDFLTEMLSRSITYVLDEDTLDLPARTLRYTGQFSVLRISDTQLTEEINGVSVTRTRKLYKLDKLTYTDTTAAFENTVGLKVGDSLLVNSEPTDTRYIVESVDSSTNSIVLGLVEGNRGVAIGANVLRIYSAQDDSLEAQVPIGFGENSVVFIKPIDPDSKIPAVNWSSGSAFYTNALTTTLTNGNTLDLQTFYQQRVVDFGKYVMSLAENKIPTASQGIIPNAPIITESDFEVVQINKQITDTDTLQSIKEQSNEKNTTSAEIKKLDAAIKSKRKTISTKNYKTTVERDADRNELNSLISERAAKSELYSSIVKSIQATAEETGIANVSPKYRVRGFWPMPSPKISQQTGEQQVVQFIIEYRYLSPEGAANEIKTITVNSDETNTTGAFSNWNIVKSESRRRVYDNTQQKYVWQDVDIQDADTINPNQLDIAITKGEQVEIRIKSLSEAGWPTNPIESDYSNSVTISFPDELSENPTENIIKENQDSLVKVQLEEDLQAKGIDQHLGTQFTANEKYFAHQAETIASGYVSDNQTPIDLFTKLTELQNRIVFLEEQLAAETGELSVQLFDDQGNLIPINRDNISQVFAGYYTDQVSSLAVKKGAIVSKTFFINLSNTKQSALQLVSSLYGSKELMVRESEDPTASAASGTILPAIYQYYNNFETYTSNDSDYNTVRKYDLVPLLLTNPDVTVNTKYEQPISTAPYASSQVKAQYLYSRFMDVSGENDFYSYANPDSPSLNIVNLDAAEDFYTRSAATGTSGNGFIWGGGFDASGATPDDSATFAVDDDCVELHVLHPLVANGFPAFKSAYESLTGDTTTFNAVTGGDASTQAKIMFRNSKFAKLASEDTLGKVQSIYMFEDPSEYGANTYGESASATMTANAIAAGYKRGVKLSFEPNDQYLLGKKSCGSYLFISSPSHDELVVDGKTRTSYKTITFGNNNSINIPLVFQYRMTDFYGDGTSGTGNIAGDSSGATTNLTYAKRIGFDINTAAGDLYSFDLEVFAKYKSDTLNLEKFPTKDLANAFSDVTSVIERISPTITPGGSTN